MIAPPMNKHATNNHLSCATVQGRSRGWCYPGFPKKWLWQGVCLSPIFCSNVVCPTCILRTCVTFAQNNMLPFISKTTCSMSQKNTYLYMWYLRTHTTTCFCEGEKLCLQTHVHTTYIYIYRIIKRTAYNYYVFIYAKHLLQKKKQNKCSP